MSKEEIFFELDTCECENCGSKYAKNFGCIKCGTVVCVDCIDGYLSDWECICKECGW